MIAKPAIDAITRAWALAAALLALLPLLLQLPGPLATGIGVAAVGVAALSWRKPLPLVLRLLLAMAMLAAVLWVMGTRLGRDSGCALLAAMLAIKPSEAHGLRDARSLAGFALFAPFAAFLLDQGPLTMLLGLLAALAGLLALQRLADDETRAAAAAPPLRQRLLATGKLVALGLPLALAAFWLFPRLATPLWGVPERALARPGLSDRMAPGEWIDLLADDTPAARVQFFGPEPSPSQMYWRGPVLWDFDGREWTQSPWLRGLPSAPVTTSKAVRWDYQIELEATDRRQLVALDLPLAAPEGTALSLDYGLFSPRPLSAPTRWRMQSAPPQSFQPELPITLRQRALALPPGRNPRTLALARQWRQQAGNDDAALVNRALDWVRAEFGYTLDVPLPGRDGVDEFLFDQKQGYCEQFSSSFVVLMRAAGIPARVVTGYVGGQRNRFGGYWLVRRMDAHAWAEVWLHGRGWVRVDPTAAVAPERIFDTLEQRAAAAGGLTGMTRLDDFGDWLRRGWNDLLLGFNATRQQTLLQPLGIEKLEGRQLRILFTVTALLALAGMAWLLARGERERDPLLRAWRRLDRRYARLGLGRQAHEPALDWARRVARLRPALGAALLPLSHRFADARYAAAVADADALLKDLRRHRPKP
ncbi:MAG: DUF3488 and transglutaminase-like domain-containing protein [Pseudoxanthomonas sp.]